jgi:hypothetical protein
MVFTVSSRRTPGSRQATVLRVDPGFRRDDRLLQRLVNSMVVCAQVAPPSLR